MTELITGAAPRMPPAGPSELPGGGAAAAEQVPFAPGAAGQAERRPLRPDRVRHHQEVIAINYS